MSVSKASSKKKRKGGHPAGRPGKVAPASFGDWIGGARLRTLPLAVAPVLIGTGAAIAASNPGQYHWVRALAALAVSLFLQIGVNYANDYSDGVRGTDAYRVGPGRLVGAGKAKPRTVLMVALGFFALAAVIGLVLVIRTELWWLLLVGAAAIVAAWFYTGGKRPYGYNALGEVFVFLFFGLAATAGTEYVQIKTVTQEGWFGAVAIGLIACATLMVNNIRDIEPDKLARKRTLAVLLGQRGSRIVFAVFLLLPFLILAMLALVYPIAWLGMLVLIAAIPAVLIAVTARTPRELILVLQLTGLISVLFGFALGAAFAF